MTKQKTPITNNLRKRIIDTANHPYWSTIITILGTMLTWTAIYFATPSQDDHSMRLLISTAFSIAVMLSLNWMWFRGLVDGQKDQIEFLSEKFQMEREAFFKDYGRQKLELMEMARRSRTFQVFTDRDDLSELLSNRIANAKNVKNTYVEIADKVSNDVSRKSKVQVAYNGWIANDSDNVWEDVVGIREFFSDRYTSVNKVPSYKGSQYVFVLKHSVPIINFIILDYQDKRPSEVYWGWVSGDRDPETPLFSTSDPDVLKTFNLYFSALKGRTWNKYFYDESDNGFLIDYTKAGKNRLKVASNRLVDKIGCWITVSYTASPTSDDISANRLGLVEIDYDEKGLKVSAKIYDTEGKLEEGTTEHREFAHYLNSVFVGYRLNDSDFTGICQYKFKRYGENELMTGVYVDRRDSVRNTLIGTRYGLTGSLEDFALSQGEAKDLLQQNDTLFRKLENFSTLVNGPTVVDAG